MAALLQRISLRLGRGPSEVRIRKRSMTSPEYAAQHRGVGWTLVEPAGTVTRRPPVHFGAEPSRLDEHLVSAFPELGVATIPGGIVAGDSAWVLGPDGMLLHDQTWHGAAREQRKIYVRREGDRFPVKRLKGTVVNLATYSASRNYGHFLLDGAARLRLLEVARVDLRAVDHILVTSPHRNANRLLERLGVPMDKVMAMPADIAYQADTLIAPTFPGLRRNYQPWLPRWFRARLAPSDVPRTRRLYVPRTTDRRIINMDQIQPILDEHGFETFEPTAHADPLQAFASAQVVVGAHGAGLSDVVVCRPGTAMLELFPSAHQMPYYYTLADGAGMVYGDLVGPSLPELIQPGDPKRWIPFRLDVAEFRTALETTLAVAPTDDTGTGPDATPAGEAASAEA